MLVAAMLLLSGGVAAAATKTVQVGPGNALVFSPSTVTIDVGDTVVWRWMSGPHTTTRTSGAETWDSGIASAPHMFSHTFAQAGTFPYVCSIHASLGMTGTVHVRAATASTTTTTPPGGGVTTTTLAAGARCGDAQACLAQLFAALPAPQSATSAKERKVARMLAHLARVANQQIVREQSAGAGKRIRLAASSTRTLERLRKLADRAATKGTLGVPSDPIDASVARLLALAG